MPFKSEAQRRLFFALERRGEISKHTLDKWQDETRQQKKGKLPEKVAFVRGFVKLALGALTGGSNMSGAGKNLNNTGESPLREGTQQSHGRADGEDTRTDKTLLDRERNPRDFSPWDEGPVLRDRSNPHVEY